MLYLRRRESKVKISEKSASLLFNGIREGNLHNRPFKLDIPSQFLDELKDGLRAVFLLYKERHLILLFFYFFCFHVWVYLTSSSAASPASVRTKSFTVPAGMSRPFLRLRR